MLAFVVFAVPGLSVDKHVFVGIDSLSVTSIAAEAGTPWLPQYSLTGYGPRSRENTVRMSAWYLFLHFLLW